MNLSQRPAQQIEEWCILDGLVGVAYLQGAAWTGEPMLSLTLATTTVDKYSRLDMCYIELVNGFSLARRSPVLCAYYYRIIRLSAWKEG